MANIDLSNFNQGGIADSKYSGVKNSSYKMVGFDIHSTPGLLKANQKMTKDSGTTVTEFCKEAITASTNIRYWFSSTSGKIWQEKAGTYTLVYTTSPTSGGAGCLGAAEYQGYLYWATEKYLHRIAVGSADGSTAWTNNAAPNWGTFDVQNASYHPMRETNMVLFIGDGNKIAQVDSGVFDPNVFDMETGYIVTALGKLGTDLIIGAFISTNVNYSRVFRWNTFSPSFTNDDGVQEEGINSFLEADNYVLVNAGLMGNIYTYNGYQLEFLKKIPGDYSPSKTCKIYPNASTMFKGSLPIFGVSNVSGNPCDEGIYSLGKYQPGYPTVLNLEFPTSNVDGSGYNILTGIEIGAVVAVGTTLYMSWAYNSTYGIDKLDYSNKIVHPYLETRVIVPDKRSMTSFKEIIANYESVPANCSIVAKYQANHVGSYTTISDFRNDTDKMRYISEAAIKEARTMQFRIEMVASGNTAPAIEDIQIEV